MNLLGEKPNVNTLLEKFMERKPLWILRTMTSEYLKYLFRWVLIFTQMGWLNHPMYCILIFLNYALCGP
jgi:hypothetical protein